MHITHYLSSLVICPLSMTDRALSVSKLPKDRLETRKKKRRKELSVPANRPADEQVDGELDLLGEGGDDGHLEPGRSVVFATLEVCLCVLVRHYPDLSPRAASINSVMAMQAKSRMKGRRLTDEQSRLVSSALSSLAALPALCSPLGAITILPSVLWLLTGVLKEASWKDALGGDSAPDAAVNLQVTAALQGLRAVAGTAYVSDDRCSARWSELLQSALLRILDQSKTAPPDTPSE